MIDPEKATVVVNTAAKKAADRGAGHGTGGMDNTESIFRFQFHHVLHNASQDTVYDMCKDVVQSVVNGTNSTIMTYGQTGSGKTFTMTGDTRNFSHRGIAPRAISQIFNEIGDGAEGGGRGGSIDYKVSCVYYEIYNEKVYDLLDDLSNSETRTDFQIAEDPLGRGVFVRGLNEIATVTEQDALNLLYSGELARTTSQHKLNRKSNRSHSIFTIYIQQRAKSGVSERIVCSKLNLVDLAGSERLKKTLDDSEGGFKIDETTKKESMYINQSLTYLEQCVVALSKKGGSGHVPYRQTKLTNVLKDSIGGNCNTLMYANMWGESAHLEETISTLRLASRMMRVTNKTSVVESFDDKKVVLMLRKEVKELKQELLMHDAMAERSGVVYDAYTPEQKGDMRAAIDKFVGEEVGGEDEYSAIELSSVRQMREMLGQFKNLVLEKNTMVQRVKTAAAAQGRGGGEAVVGDAGSDGAEAKIGSGGAYSGGADFGDSKDAVGDIVSGDGFGYGRAGEDSRPAQLDQPPGSGSPSKNMNTSLMSLPQSPEKDIFSYEAEPKTSPARSNKPDGFSQSKGEVPDDKEEAFALYKRTKGRKESEMAIKYKAEVKFLKGQAKLLARECNEYKEDIDRLTAMLGLKKESRMLQMQPGGLEEGVDVVDQEEFDIMKEQRDAKRGYKVTMSEFQSLKSNIEDTQGRLDDTKYELLTNFDMWHGLAVGTIVNNDAGADAGGGDGEIMDDAELFEKMELSRISQNDPDSVAFFQAQKTRRANQTQNSLSISQMRRNKRSVGV